MTLKIDHFTLGANDLNHATAYLEALTGAVLPKGGKHPLMSTHNGLTSTGERQFMELIAIDPEAPAPNRIRWFSLDDENTKARISERPRALCWVVETNDLDNVVANSPVDLGEIVHLSRDNRTWRLTVPKDGSLPEHGAIPAFIEWSPGPHPSQMQQDIGIRLEEIIIHHPEPDWLHEVFLSLGIAEFATIKEGEHALSFDVATPNGRLMLD